MLRFGWTAGALVFSASWGAACNGGLQNYQPGNGVDTGTGGPGTGFLLGDLSISVEDIDFGTVEPGGEAVEDVVLRNTGDELITVKQALLDGDYVFTVDTVTWPSELEPEADMILTVRFKPLHEASFGGTLSISTAEQSETANIGLVGVGGVEVATDDSGDTTNTTNDFAVSPMTLSFGVVDVGDTKSKDVTIVNNGVDDVLIVDVFGTDDTITYTGAVTPPQVLAGGSSKTVTVQFSPTAEVNTNATFEIEMDPPELSTSIPVTGEGIQNCTICSPAISVNTGGPSDTAIDDFVSFLGLEDTRTVKVSNIGDEPLEVTDIRVTNDLIATCGNFTLSGPRTGTLDPGELLSFDVTYKANAICLEVPSLALDSNILHIESNDPWTADYRIELSGAGVTF